MALRAATGNGVQQLRKGSRLWQQYTGKQHGVGSNEVDNVLTARLQTGPRGAHGGIKCPACPLSSDGVR